MVEFLKPVEGCVKTMTTDNGGEFALHERLDCTSYFYRPYTGCQRGNNENANGLIR